MLSVLFSLALVGCPGGEKPEETPGGAAAVAPAPKSEMEQARALFALGDAQGALKHAEVWLSEHADDDAAWDLVELAAVRANDAAGLVDRLSADQALGGRADRHHALRGALAVLASRPADALVAARALATLAPGDSAALYAGAIALGAPTPEGLPPTTLLLLAAQADPKTKVDPTVDALPGWRLALVRAHMKEARGDRAGAIAELSRLPAGLPRLHGLPLALSTAPDAAAAWSLAETAAREASTSGDSVGAGIALDGGLPFALAGWKGDAAASVALELRKKAEEAKNTEGAAALAAVEAHASLRSGQPLAARAAAAVAAAGTTGKGRGSWEVVLSSAAIGDAAGVDGAVAGLAEPRASAARDLALVLRGGDKLPGAGLEGDDAALVALLAAGWLNDPSAAAARADVATSPDLKLWGAAWASSTSLSAAGGTALSSEAGAREFLKSGGGAAIVSDHPNSVAWNAVIAGEAGAPGAGVAAWARARTALAAGDVVTAANEYAAFSLAAPDWRTGPWAPVLTLDGVGPEFLPVDSERVRAAADPVTPAVVLHGWSHRRETTRALWRAGTPPLGAAATAAQADTVWDAAARYRYESLKWLATNGAYPLAARDALTAAEAAAGLTRPPVPDLVGLRAALDSAAVISFRTLPGMVEILFVTPSSGKLVRLKPQTVEAMTGWTRAVSAGDGGIADGDRLRAAVLDSANDVLSGLGRFYVLGPTPLGSFAINSLPEQGDGLRFLADIRSVSYYPDFDAVVATPLPPQDEFQHTLVALCATPIEAEMIRRLFPNSMVLEGPAATVAAWKANAGGARFVHIGDFPMGPAGGWQLADAELTLREAASTKLTARGGYVSGGPDPLGSQARLAALRRAGLQDFLLGAPAVDTAFHQRLVGHFWEGVNRRYTASRSFYDSRATTLKEFDAGNRPVNWVRYLIAGKP